MQRAPVPITSILLLVAACHAAPVGNLVENGSFEAGDCLIEVVPTLPAAGFWTHVQVGSNRLQGWSVELSPDDPDAQSTTAGLEWVGSAPTKSTQPDGLMMVDLVNATDFFKLSTTLPTSKQKRYRATFWVNAGGVVTLKLVGETVRLLQAIPVQEDVTWRMVAFSFTADSAVTRLEIWASQTATTLAGSGPLLDDVRVVPIEESVLSIGLYAGLRTEGTPGKTYRIEYASAVRPEDWNVLTNIVLPETPYFLVDPTPVSHTTERFYRAVELP